MNGTDPQLLYNALVDKKLYTKSYDEFVGQFASPEKQAVLYDNLKEKGLYTKSYDEFVNQYFTDATQKKKDGGLSEDGLQKKSSDSNVANADDGWGDPSRIIGERDNRKYEKGYSWDSTEKVAKISNAYQALPAVNQKKARTDFAKEVEEDNALTQIKARRNGDYNSPGDVIALKNEENADVLKKRLKNKSPMEAYFQTNNSQGSLKEYEWHLSALQSEHNNLELAIRSVDRSIERLYGDNALKDHFENIERLNQLRQKSSLISENPSDEEQNILHEYKELENKVLSFEETELMQTKRNLHNAFEKNREKAISHFKDTRFKDVQKLFERRKASQTVSDAASDVLPFANYAGQAISKSLLRLSAGFGTLMNISENLAIGDDEYNAWDVVEDFMVGVTKDSETYMPTPSKWARPMFTVTAKWNGYEADIDKSTNEIVGVWKKGQNIGVNELSDEAKAQILSAERTGQVNLEGLPYKAVTMASDLLIQLATTKGAGAITPAFITNAATRGTIAVTASTIGSMAHPLYEEGMQIFNGDIKKASQYAIEAAALIGISSNMFGLEARVAGVGKGMFDIKSDKWFSPTQSAVDKAAKVLFSANSEMLEETIVENGIKNLVGLTMNTRVEDYQDTELVEDALMSFLVGAIVGGGEMIADSPSPIYSSSIIAAAKNIKKFKEELIVQGKAGMIPGIDSENESQIKDFAEKKATEILADAKSAELIEGVNQVESLPLVKKRREIAEKIEAARSVKMPVLVEKYEFELKSIDEQILASMNAPVAQQSVQPEQLTSNFRNDETYENRRVLANGMYATLRKNDDNEYELETQSGEVFHIGSESDLSQLIDLDEIKILEERQVSFNNETNSVSISGVQSGAQLEIVTQEDDATGNATSFVLQNKETGKQFKATEPSLVEKIEGQILQVENIVDFSDDKQVDVVNAAVIEELHNEDYKAEDIAFVLNSIPDNIAALFDDNTLEAPAGAIEMLDNAAKKIAQISSSEFAEQLINQLNSLKNEIEKRGAENDASSIKKTDINPQKNKEIKKFDVTKAVEALDIAIDELGRSGVFNAEMSNESLKDALNRISFTRKMPAGFILSVKNGEVSMDGEFGAVSFSIEDVSKEIRKKFNIGAKATSKRVKDVAKSLKIENVTDDIAVAFSEGLRVPESSFARHGDPNTVKDNPALRMRFFSKKTDSQARTIDQWAAQLAEKWGIEESDAINQIVSFISEGNTGGYLKNRIDEQRRGYLHDEMFSEDISDFETLDNDEMASVYDLINTQSEFVEGLTEEEKFQLHSWLVSHVDSEGNFDANEALDALIDESFAESFLGFSQNLYKKITDAVNTVQQGTIRVVTETTNVKSGLSRVEEDQETYSSPKNEKVKTIENLMASARGALAYAQKEYSVKRKQLLETAQKDQLDLFGNRESIQPGMLFDERADTSRITQILLPYETAIKKHQAELKRLQQLYEQAKAEKNEPTLFDQSTTLTRNGFPIGKKVSDWINKFVQETFFSKGLLNKEVFALNQKRVGMINSQMELVRQTKKKFDKALSQVYGKKTATIEQLEDINEALKNPALMSGGVVLYRNGSPIEAPIRKVLRDMRTQVNALSGELVALGVAQGDLAITILDNMDAYLTRAYRVHDDKDWIDSVQKLPVWNKAISWFKTNQTGKIQTLQNSIVFYEAMRDEAEHRVAQGVARRVNSLPGTKERADAENFERKAKKAYRFWAEKISFAHKQIDIETDAFNDPEASLKAMLIEQQDNLSVSSVAKTGSLGSKNLGIFQRRKKIPQEVRDLFGEYNDPLANYGKSIFKQIHLLENAKFLREVERQGLNKYLFVTPTGEYTTKIAAKGSATMSPLSGYYTTQELAEAFKKFNEPNNVPGWLYPMVFMSSAAKYSKTILSAVTHVRNFYFNTFFHLANGRMPSFSDYKEALEIVKADIDFLNGSPEAEARLRHLIELGIIGDGVTFNEIKSLMDDVKSGWDDIGNATWVRKIKKPIKRGLNVAEQLYEAEDDFHKVVAFEVEKARYAKALYNKKYTALRQHEKEVIELKAAQIVLATMPTYSLIPKNIKELRRVPFVGTFVSFPYETMRTAKNTITLASEELAEKSTRSIGIKRILGMASATAGTLALSKLMHLFLGFDEEDEDHLRWFLPPWSENSIIVPVKREKVDVSYIDISSILPHGYILSVMNTLFDKRKDTKNTSRSFIETLFRPFFSQDMVMKRISEAYNNQTESGKEIAAEDDESNIRKRLIYASEVFVPGTITTGARLIKSMTNPELDYFGRLYPEIEVMTITTGIRVSPVNIEGSFLFKAKSLAERARNDKQIYYKERSKQKYADLNETEKIMQLRPYKEKAIKAYSVMMEDAIECYAAALKLGSDPSVLEDHLRKAGFNATEIDNIGAGLNVAPAFDDDAPKRKRAKR